MSERQRKYAMAGGLCGAAYLAENRLLPGLPDILLGTALGLGVVFLVLSLLPEKAAKTVRKWKRRGR